MDELGRKAEAVAAELDPGYTPSRVEASLGGFLRRRRRRRLGRVAAGGLGLAGAALVIGLWVARGRGANELHLADGTTIVPEAGALVVPLEIGPARTVIGVERGAADFAVPHVEGRSFTVRAGGISVEVVGTVFAVRRRPDAVEVSVTEGRVVVDGAGERAAVSAGETRRFVEAAAVPAPPARPISISPPMPPPAPAETPPPPPPPPHHAPPPRPHVDKPAPPAADWKSLARDGAFDDAYGRLKEAAAPPAVSVEELLLAADVARLSGHPAEAIPDLQRILAEHPGDPRAAITAFTLGRVLLDDLGRPTEAAAAFARARQLAPEGPLVEDALAREVEAWSRAGDTERAAELARRYVARYPDGHRLRAVKRFGGLQ